MSSALISKLSSQLAAARQTDTDGRHARAAEAYTQVIQGTIALRNKQPPDSNEVQEPTQFTLRHQLTVLLSEASSSAGYNLLKNFQQPQALQSFKDALKYAQELENADPSGCRLYKGYAYAGMSQAYHPKGHDDPRRSEYANKAKALAHSLLDDVCQAYADVGGEFVLDTQAPETRLMANRFIAGDAVEDTTLTSNILKARMLVAAAERASAMARVSK